MDQDHQLVEEENSSFRLHSVQQPDDISVSKPWNNINCSQAFESYTNFKPKFSSTSEWESDMNFVDDGNHEQLRSGGMSPGSLDLYMQNNLFPMAAEHQEAVLVEPQVLPDQDVNSSAKFELLNGHRELRQHSQKRERTCHPQSITVNGEEHRRPDLSYVAMIFQAIEESSTKMLSLSEIYVSITRRYPFFKLQDNQRGWQNSIRHNLSLNDCFVKHEREPGAGERKGCYWAVDPSATDLYKDGYHRRRRMKRTSLPRLHHVTSSCVDLAAQQTRPYCGHVGHFPYSAGSGNVQHTSPANYIYGPYVQQGYRGLNGPALVNAGASFPSTLTHHNNHIMAMPLQHLSNSALAHCNRNTLFHPLNHGSHVNMLQSWAFSRAHLANIYAAHTGSHGSATGCSVVTRLASAISPSPTPGRFQCPVTNGTKFVYPTG